MGTYCAPLLADLFLYSYEAEFIQTLIRSGKRQLAKSFNFTFRYIDDVLSLNNSKFSDYINDIYIQRRVSCMRQGMLTLSGAPSTTSLIGYYHLSVFGL